MTALPSWLEQLSLQQGENPEVSLDQSILDHVTLEKDFATAENNSTGNYVSLMSIHSAKGLEFPYVFVCGVEEELLPHRNSIGSPQQVEEERRLFYVALTRAKKRLFFSYAQKRGTGRFETSSSMSRFLSELPKDDSFVFTRQAAEPEKNEKETLKSLSGLRAILNERGPQEKER